MRIADGPDFVRYVLKAHFAGRAKRERKGEEERPYEASLFDAIKSVHERGGHIHASILTLTVSLFALGDLSDSNKLLEFLQTFPINQELLSRYLRHMKSTGATEGN
jgi:hypothetical protein